MNYIVITIVIIIILMYVLWRYSVSSNILIQNQNLNNVISTPINIQDTSTRFAYGVWIYVNSWNPTGTTKTIFSRNSSGPWDDSGKITDLKYTTRLYLDSSAPTLYLDIKQGSCSSNTVSSTPPITITTNFPIQKWCYVTFSVDGQYVDCYIDGKLVKSALLNCLVVAPGANEPLYIGNTTGGNDTYINSLYHWSNSITPQEVWNKYLKGNSSNPITNTFKSFGLGISIFKNNVENIKYRIF